MKLSNATRDVLKNFSTINANLMVREGNTLKTISSMKNIVATATIPDSFTKEFGIYDLNEFLASMSLFKTPDLAFDDNRVVIKEDNGRSKCDFYYSDPSVITTVTKDITMPSVDVEFELTEDTLNSVLKAAAVLGAPDLVLTAEEGGDIELKVSDKKNDTSNSFSVKVGENATSSYKYYFKVENLKLIPGTYKVEVSSRNISRFVNQTIEVEYFIALES